MKPDIIRLLYTAKSRQGLPVGFVIKAVKHAAKLSGGLRFVFKTVAFYERVMRSEINNFFRTGDTFAFLDRMFDLIEDQFGRAYNQGLRDVGWDKPLTDRMINELNDRTEFELSNLLSFAQEMEVALREGRTATVFLNRVPLWANRYNELVAMGAFAGGIHDDLYEWVLGQTERHCYTCLTLSGTVASKEEWESSGLRPQNAPNARLECGGWQCDCTLVPVTDKQPTGIPRV